MKKPKTHFAHVDRATESETYDTWYTTYCGLEYTESKKTNEPNFVTCKRCLKTLSKKP